MMLTASKGLGDAIYLRAIVLSLTGELTVFTKWPEVFADLPVTVKPLEAITGEEDMHYAVYCLSCRNPCVKPLDLFSRAALRAGLDEVPAFRMGWKVKNRALVERVKGEANGRPVLLFQPLKVAKNDEQRMLRPDKAAFRSLIKSHSKHFRVKVGSPKHCDNEEIPCELDLFGKTSVSDVFDLGIHADLIVGEPCFLTVMAEAMDKPFVCMFSRVGVESPRIRVNSINPKMFNKPHLATAIYG